MRGKLAYKIFFYTFFVLLPNKVKAGDFYTRLYTPAYTNINNSSKMYKIRGGSVSINQKMQTNFSVGIGYKFSDSLDLEFSISQSQYSANYFEELQSEKNIDEKFTVTTPGFPQKLFSIAYFRNKYRFGCSSNPLTFMDKTRLCSIPIELLDKNRVQFFTIAWNRNIERYGCASNPRVFMTRNRVCGESVIVPITKKVKEIKKTATNISSQIYTFIPTLRFRPIQSWNRITPYISAGVGLAISANKIKRSFSDFTPNQSFSNTTIAPAFEIGLGTQIKLTNQVNFDIEAKYFNYGTHKFTPINKAKLSGYKLSAGVTIYF